MPSSSSYNSSQSDKLIMALAKELHEKVMREYKRNPDLTYNEILNKYLDDYNKKIQKQLEVSIGEILTSGVGGISMTPVHVTQIQLSARLYKNSQYVAKVTMKVINQHLDNKSTINEIRESLYDGYGYDELMDIRKSLPNYLKQGIDIKKLESLKTKALKAAYLDVALAKNDKALEKAMKVALEEKARSYALRVARTEEAKSFNRMLINEMLNEDVELVRWTRSGRQSIACICDYYENKDVGYGPGVYKIMEAPVPVFSTHPNCLCVLRDVGRPYNKQRKKTSDKDQRAIDYAKDHGWDEVKVRDLV